MQITWPFCLCVLLVVSPPELLVINNFETEGGWEAIAAEGCTIGVFLDRISSKEGQTSVRIEAEFTEPCSQKQCYAGIALEVPDLTGYTFLRLWVKPEGTEGIMVGIHLKLTGEREAFYVIPYKSGWHLVTISFSQFKGGEEQPVSVTPEDIEAISFFIAANSPAKARVNVDGLAALTDSNGNEIPDVDEGTLVESAANSEQMGDRYFNEKDYEKARKYYEEAKSLYEQLKNPEKAREMEQKALESRAMLDLERAEDLYAQKKYPNAMEAYERARRGFLLLGNLDMVDRIENRLEELSELTGRPVSPRPGSLSATPYEQSDRSQERVNRGGAGLLLVLIIVCVMGVGVYLWKFRGAPEPEAEPETREEKLTPPSEARAEEIRKLKAKFVYGEISRKDYEEKLRELGEKL
jgi:tetratricopeptide (TPR) repeat protein